MDATIKFNKELQPVVKQAIQSIASDGGHLSLTKEVCVQLLQSSEPSQPQVAAIEAETPLPEFEGGLSVIGGYPQYPLYERLSLALAYWMVTGTCPVSDLPVMYMLNEAGTLSERQEKLEAVGTKVTGRSELWEMWSKDERQYTIRTVLQELDLRGVLDLLGIRCTAGSADILPPSQEQLLSTFTSLHHPSAKLSVGGRALSKHSHRDVTDNWWGVCTGSEDEKNRHALRVTLKILKSATWINIHKLPQEVTVIEVRTFEGYGVRWRHDGSEFRGFLEPQMVDGHTVGWRH